MANVKSLYTVRALQEKDIPFLFSSYLKSYRPYFNHLGNDAYYALHHERMAQFIERGAIGAIAVSAEDPDVILGWTLITVTDDAVVVFFTYVKHAFRGLKIASTMMQQLSDLLPKRKVILLHQTPGGLKLGEKVSRKGTYNPYHFELTKESK